MTVQRVTRRRFVTTAAAACAAPLVIRASALGAEGKPAPSNRITVGMIGVGRQAQVRQPASSSWRCPTCRSWPSATSIRGGWPTPSSRSKRLTPRASPSGSYKGCDTYAGLPRTAGPQGHRRRDDLHARPLARADGPGGDGGGQGRVAGKADHAQHRRRPQAGRRGQATETRVPRRQRVAVLPAHRAGGRTGPQRPDRQGPHGDRGRAGQRRRLPAAAGNARAAGTGLRALARARPRGPRTPSTASTSPRPTSGPAGCGTCTTATA